MTEPINESIEDHGRLIEQIIDGRQAMMWTAIPAYVTKYDPEAITCDCQPTISGIVRGADGSVEQVSLPLLLDCPVVFPHAGGGSLTFPIKEDDEVLVVFSSRGIDFWWQSGGVQPPTEMRMHDLSDGFVLPGVWSQPKKIPSPSTTAVQIRSDDGGTYIELNVSSKDINVRTPASVGVTASGNLVASISGTASVSAQQGMMITAPTVTINGNLVLNGSMTSNAGTGGASGATITGDVVADGISLKSHVHGSVQSGNSRTGGPQ